MKRPTLAKEKLFLGFMLAALVLGGVVYATVVGPNGIYDVGYYNGTLINVEQIFIDSVNYTASIIAGSGWDGTGALFQNGTRELTDNWDAGAYNITADNFTAADFYLESVGNLTAYIDSEVAGAGGTATSTLNGYDYAWNRTGANYFYIQKNGTATSGADFDALLNAILTADSYTGSHYFGPYVFQSDDNITGIGDGASYGRHLIFRGAGAGVTEFEFSGNSMFVSSSGLAWDLYGFTVDLGDGHGIYAYDDGGAGAYDECGIFRAIWDDLEFISGTAGSYAMYLENPEWLRIGNIRVSCTTGVYPFIARLTPGVTYKYGDVQFDGIFTASYAGNDVIGMTFLGTDDTWRLNLFGGSGKIWLKCLSGTNTTGAWLDWVENYNLGKFQIDSGTARVLYVDHSFGGIIEGGMYTTSLSTDGSGFNLTSSAYGTLIRNWVLFGTGNCSWANSAVASANNYAKFEGITLWTVAGEFHETIGAFTQFERLHKRGGGTYPGRFPT